MSLDDVFEKANKSRLKAKKIIGKDKDNDISSSFGVDLKSGLDNEKIQEIQKSLESKRERLEENDIPIPKEYQTEEKTGLLNRIFSTLKLGETAPYVKAMQEDYSLLDTFKTQIDRAWTETIKGEKYEYETPLQEDIDTATYSDVLEKEGWQPEDTTERFMRSAVGLGLDVLADPKTYLTFGTSGAAKKVFTPGKGFIDLTDEGARLLDDAVAQFGPESGRKALATAIEFGGDDLVADRALVRFGKRGQEILPKEMVTKPAKFIDDTLSNMKHGGGVYKGVKGFLNKTKDSALAPFDYFSDLKSAPKEIRDEVEHLEKAIKRGVKADIDSASVNLYSRAQEIFKTTGDDAIGKKMRAMVERGEKISGIKPIDNFIALVAENNKRQFQNLKGAGFELGELPFDHYIKRELDDYGKRFFKELKSDEASNNFIGGMNDLFKAGKASSQKGRKINRIVSEFGDDITWEKSKKGLKRLDSDEIYKKFEDDLAKTTRNISDKLEKILNPELAERNTTLKELLDSARKSIDNNNFGGVVEVTGDFSDENYETAVKFLTDIENRKLNDKLLNLRDEIVTSQGDEFLYKPLKEIENLPKEVKASKLFDEILDAQNQLAEKMRKIDYYDFVDKDGNFYKEILSKEDMDGFAPLTVKEINKQMRKVGKEMGLDVSESDKFFKEDIFSGLLSREAEYQKMMGASKFADEISDRLAFSKNELTDSLVNQLDDNLARTGKEFFIKDGVKYVKGNMKMYGQEMLTDRYIPEPVKKHLSRAGKFFSKDSDEINVFLTVYDKALRLFKKNVTGYFPAFHTRNAIGGVFNNYLAGVSDPRLYGKTGKILKYKKALDRGEDVADELLELGGNKFKLSKLVKEFDKRHLFNQPGAIDVMRDLDDYSKAIQNLHGPKRIASELAEAPRRGFEFVENQLRIPLFLDRVAKGDSFENAAKQVYKYHFDYAPEFLTKTEKNVIKRIIPFYTWTKNNIPLQIENLIKQPGKYSVTDKLRREIDAVSGKDKVRVERENMPDWMKDMFTIRMPNVKDTGEPYFLQLDLPMDDLNRLNMTDIASMTSPLLKFPAERFFNKDFFFGSQIYDENLPREYQTKQTIDALKNLPKPVRDFLGVQEVKGKNFYTGEFEDRVVMDSRNLHMLQGLFFSRFYSSADDLFDTEASTAEKITKLASGTPLRPLEVDKQKWYRMKEKDYELGNYISHLLQRQTIPYANEDPDEFIQGTGIPKESFSKKIGNMLLRPGE